MVGGSPVLHQANFFITQVAIKSGCSRARTIASEVSMIEHTRLCHSFAFLEVLQLVPRLHCPVFLALWKNTGREPGLLGTSHDVPYVM